MKALVLFPALLLAAASIAAAQETYGTIHITTRLRPDGTRATTKVDPDEHTAIETITDGANKVLSKTTYLLDENGVSLSAIFADAKGKAIYKATYSRDSAGRVSEAAFSSPDGRYLGKRVFVYGASDKSTQIVDYDANGQQIAQAQPVNSKKKKH